MSSADTMGEVIALENEIMAALPKVADAVAIEGSDRWMVIARAHDILCNAWRGPGARLDRLREIAIEMRGLIQQ